MAQHTNEQFEDTMLDLMLVNALCSSAHPNTYSRIVWSEAAVLLMNPELQSSELSKNVYLRR